MYRRRHRSVLEKRGERSEVTVDGMVIDVHPYRRDMSKRRHGSCLELCSFRVSSGVVVSIDSECRPDGAGAWQSLFWEYRVF